jgi:uncharacterized membrane protein YhaH (DUF805 family)
MSWYLAVLKKYAVFVGRARRTEYWYFFLFNLIITIALILVDTGAGTFYAESGFGLLSSLYTLGVLLPSMGVTIRRLHDTGRTGWWVLLMLVPVIGPLVMLVFLVLDSQPGDNAYGPNPKAAAT